jgi:hypothetical protein
MPGATTSQRKIPTDMKPNLSVSVIIVNWNARDFLRDCLRSLADRVSEYPLEIIVVDNGSIDGSAECVEREFPRVQLIRNQSNLGFARANNIAIRQSNGRYVCLINSDVKVLKDCITHLVDYCEQHHDVGMVGPCVFGADGRRQRSCRGFPTLWNTFCRSLALDTIFPKRKVFTGYSLSHWSQDTLRAVDILSGCFWLVRREAIAQVGLLDESFFMYGEDMDWCKRFWGTGWKLVFVPTAQAVHYGGASAANAPIRFFIEMQRADLQYWKKHHSRPAVACYFLISCLHLTLRAVGYTIAAWFARETRQAYRHKISRSVAGLHWMFSGRSPSQTKSPDIRVA